MAKGHRLTLSPEAAADIAELRRRRKKARKETEALLSELRERFRTLRDNPEAGREWLNDRRLTTVRARRISLSVVYRLKAGVVEVLGVVDGRADEQLARLAK